MLFASDGSELVVRLAVGAADSDGTIVGTPVGSRLGEVDLDEKSIRKRECGLLIKLLSKLTPAILGENEGTPLVEG